MKPSSRPERIVYKVGPKPLRLFAFYLIYNRLFILHVKRFRTPANNAEDKARESESCVRINGVIVTG
jgi:hypothetical protein